MSMVHRSGCQAILCGRLQVDEKIAGVVLAGGKSSRMGQNKALLDYNGRPLLDHMISVLEQTELDDIYVSGDIKGYRCIPDNAPHEGPARAICDVLKELGQYDGVLFVPVDMPLLNAAMLRFLLKQKNGGYFTNFPLPAFIKKPFQKTPSQSVKEILLMTKAQAVALPSEFECCMKNTNTPEEWAEVSRA